MSFARLRRSTFFLWGLAVLLVVSLFGGLAFYLVSCYGEDTLQGKLGLKTGELLIQMILIVVAGGVFVQGYNRGQAKRAAINDFRKATLHSLVKAYSDTKKARRTLRARQAEQQEDRSSSEAISYSAYDEHMETINDTQLALEVIKRELHVFHGAFDDATSLIGCVRTMESYLGEIIDEYEKTLRLFHGKASIPMAQLPKLNSFVVKSSDSDFSKFSEAFHQSLELIQLERVRPG